MGNYFFKQEIDEQQEMLSNREVIKEKVFDVYLMVYAERSDQSIGYISPGINSQPAHENLSGNAGHFAIGFDLTGQSKEGDHPALFEIHLIMDPKQSKKFGSLCGSITSDKVTELQVYYNKLFNEKFIKEDCKGDINWGKSNNCHNFAKLCIKDLELPWPESVVSPLDNYPFLSSLWSAYQDAEFSTHQTF